MNMQLFRYTVLAILWTCLMIGLHWEHHALNARVAIGTLGFTAFWGYDYAAFKYQQWQLYKRAHLSYDDVPECF